MTSRFVFSFILSGLVFSAMVSAEPWPQFRGPNASGVSLEKHSLPSEITPDKNVLWSKEIPPGVSSPVIFGERMYLTAERENKQLVTMAINTVDGQIVWEQLAPIHQLEKTDRKPQGRLATPSAATDGERIVVFFGSSGLLCYDTSGNLINNQIRTFTIGGVQHRIHPPGI